jgi:hemolysin III
MANYSPEQDLREERLNSFTHLLGIVFGLVGIPILILNACECSGNSIVAGTIIYGFSFLMVFTFSTLFHWQTNVKMRKLFLILDHISIYFLIAGTYTPFILIFINNSFGMMLLSVLWSLTVLGIFFKIFYTGRFEIISTLIYLVMGWMLLTGAREFFANMPPSIIVLIITGAALYSIGVLFYIWRFFAYNHAVWHLFVLSAAICHFSAVLMSVPTAAN